MRLSRFGAFVESKIVKTGLIKIMSFKFSFSPIQKGTIVGQIFGRQRCRWITNGHPVFYLSVVSSSCGAGINANHSVLCVVFSSSRVIDASHGRQCNVFFHGGTKVELINLLVLLLRGLDPGLLRHWKIRDELKGQNKQIEL
jgi:hypothetical protein